MSYPSEGPAGPAGQVGSLEGILADLEEILDGDRATYLSLGPKGAILSVKWPEAFAFGEALVARWVRMTPRGRAEALVDWIRRAAAYCRNPRPRQSWIESSVA